jgi:trehalose 6-phosphate phosphatase
VKNILAAKHLPTLRHFARQRVLLAFDFDGTLAPIVRDPKVARMRAKTRALLARLADLCPCVVISGRARADVAKKVEGVNLRAVIGNHGMEPPCNPRKAPWRAMLWLAQLASNLPKIPGIVVEDKGPSLAIHYRLARSRAAVRRQILIAAADLPDTRIVEGKMVVNILPADASDKGTALVRLRKNLHCESAIYLGDDENDEDVFALASDGQLLGIRVGHSRRSRAAYFLPGQTDVDVVLAEFIDSRRLM